MTLGQLREIDRRAGIGRILIGKARGEYVLGCAIGEPRAELLKRVRKVDVDERARFRAEIEADRAKAKGPREAGPMRTGQPDG